MKNLPHPAIVLDDSPQLRSVIAELEAGTYPQPVDIIWRPDLPRDLAVRLAKATGATPGQVAAAGLLEKILAKRGGYWPAGSDVVDAVTEWLFENGIVVPEEAP